MIYLFMNFNCFKTLFLVVGNNWLQEKKNELSHCENMKNCQNTYIFQLKIKFWIA